MTDKNITHCRQPRQNNFSRKAELPIPVLVILLLAIIAGTIHLWPADENFAKPTIIEQTEEIQLTQPETTTPPITAAITLEEPKQKIDPKLIEELKQLKKEKKQQKIKILAETKNVEQLKKQYSAIKIIGNIAIIETTPEEAEKLTQNELIEQIATEKEYQLFIDDRITAFSVDKVWENNYTGKGIKIAILDTGVGPHDNLTITKAKSFVDDNPLDTEGHGTHVAGIAQKTAPNAQIYNAKVFKAKTAKTTAIIEAINWAIEEKVDIISMSFGSSATDPILTSVLKDAIEKGVKVIAAAGNCKTNTCSGYFGVTYPGNIKEIITVGAIDDENKTAVFSSSDTYADYSKPDILAPGVNILSTAPNNQYAVKHGTSMSTPFVAGITALLLEKEGTLGQEKVKEKLTANGIVIEPVRVLGVGEARLENDTEEIIAITPEAENSTKNLTVNGTEQQESEQKKTYPADSINIEEFGVSVNKTLKGQEVEFIIRITNKHNETIPAIATIETTGQAPIHSEKILIQPNTQTIILNSKIKEIAGAYKLKASINAENIHAQSSEQELVITTTDTVSIDQIIIPEPTPTGTPFPIYVTLKNSDPISKYCIIIGKVYNETYEDEFKIGSAEITTDLFNRQYLIKMPGEYKLIITADCEGNTNSKTITVAAEQLNNTNTVSSFIIPQIEQEIMSTLSEKDKRKYELRSKSKNTNPYAEEEINLQAADDYTYCDWGDNTGNTYCNYYGKFKDFSSRGTDKGDTYWEGIRGDKTTPRYEEQDAYGAAGTHIYSTTSTSVKFSYDAQLFNRDEGGVACTPVSSTKCNLYEYELYCKGSLKKASDPCLLCAGLSDESTYSCTPSMGEYWAEIVAYGYHFEGYYMAMLGEDVKFFDCVANSDCSSGKTCTFGTAGSSCVCTDTAGCDSCLDKSSGSSCNCDNECSGGYCWGDSTSTYKCKDTCATSGKYAFDSSECCSGLSWDSSTQKCYTPCTAGYTGETRCSGNTVEKKYISTTCAESWTTDTTCTTDQYCSSGSCAAKTCTNYGKTSCTESGTKKKETSKLYNCENQYTSGTLLCWNQISTNGDSDYCDKLETFGLTCDRGEYDCDSDSECASGLACQGGLFTLGDGCCKSTDTWDSSTKTCRRGVDEACLIKEDCKTNNCVSGLCKKLGLGAGCTTSDQCDSGLCTGGVCSTPPCVLTTPTWSPPATMEGSTVTLTTTGTSCEGKTAKIDIYEDVTGFDPIVKTFTALPYTGSFTTPWTTPIKGAKKDYYYKVTPSTGAMVTSGTLTALKLPSPEGASCSVSPDCASGLCLSGICTKTCTDVDGDGYGTEITPACPETGTDCDDTLSSRYPGAPELCNGKDDDCDGSTDEGNVCCGNGACDNSETSTTCPGDCFGLLNVLSIKTAPTNANQADTVTVVATVKNIGTITDTLKLEAGIAPDYWQGTLFDFEEQAYTSITKCCTGNDYYTAKEITLGPGATEDVTFTLKAPTVTTTDTCSTNKNYKTAWDSSHEVIVGLYEECGIGYTHRITKDIKVNDISCTQPSQCPTGTTCKFTGTTGTCQPKICTDLCTKGTYTCNGNIIRECAENECTYWKDIKTCMTGYACESGKNTCQDTNIDTTLSVEEAGTTTVKKQTGDKATIQLKYKESEEITLEYDTSNFELQDCSNTFTISKDTNCTLKVTGNKGTHSIKLKSGQGGYIQIIEDPSGIILTNKEKLYERYKVKSEVDALLQKSYVYAESNNLIVYDLAKEIGTKHPWNIFLDYKETEYNPFMKDNSYSLETAQLIREKCKTGCKNTIIIGDDYIVPHYRRDAQFLNNYWIFWDKEETDSIYSDIPYVNRKEKSFSEFDDLFYYNEEYSGKRMVIIKPSTVSPEMTKQLTTLKKVLEAKFHPDFEEIESEDVYCNDDKFFSDFNGATLFVLGTEENNKAYNCMPFVTQLESSDSAFIEVNPWDGNNYAVIVNTDNPKVLEAFTAFVDTGKYEKATSKALWFAEVGLDTLGYLSILCTGAAIPCDTIVDGFSTEFYCAVKQDMTMCSVSAAMIAVPYIPAAPVKTAVKSFMKDVGHFAGQLMRDAGQETINLFVRAFKRGKLDETYTLLKNMGDCAFSTSSFEIQSSGCPSHVNFAKLLKTRSTQAVDRLTDASYKNREFGYRMADAASTGISDTKLIRMIDSEILIDGPSLKNFKQIGDKEHVGLMTDAKGNNYYFKIDTRKKSIGLERMSYRLNYVLDEGESIVKVPKARIIEGVNVDGELQTGLLTEDLGGDSLYNTYEQGMKTGKWKEGLPGQLDFFKYSKDLTDAQREVMQKQIVRDFLFGSTDRNLGNIIKTVDGKIGFIDYQYSFLYKDLKSPLFSVPPKVKDMLESERNLLLEHPQFKELSERWKLFSDESSGSLTERKKILDSLEPEVRKMEKLSVDEFDAAIKFEELTDSKTIMEEIKKELFGTTGKNGRISDFVKDFNALKASVEAKLK